MTLSKKECFNILELPENANINEVKGAYRRLAFALHPDLNQTLTDAPQRFHQLNEAYVFLIQQLSSKEHGAGQQKYDQNSKSRSDKKARTDASQAYEKAQAAYQERHEESENQDQETTEQAETADDLLKDILKDDFARRVFEDIYRHMQSNAKGQKKTTQPLKNTTPPSKKNAHKQVKPTRFVNKISGWLRRQIDDEQTITLPKEALAPGAKVRLEIQHGLLGNVQTIELTLPPEFTPEKPIRLKGLGKRLGSLSGDLYVRIQPSN